MVHQFLRPFFHGVGDEPSFYRSLKATLDSLNGQVGSFASDNLVAFNKNLSFLTNRPFMSAFLKNAKTRAEQGIIWRNFTVAWAAKQGLRLEGDFVECGCYKGITARITCDYINFGSQQDRHYYLYDLFEHDSSMPHHAMPEHGATLFEQTKLLFADLPNVSVIQGRVPDSFEQGVPEKIAFLHLDLNNVEGEIAALEVLFDRMVPGAVMVLDDYGWLGYRKQKLAEDAWFGKRGYDVLELPTGQGLLIK